MTASARATVAAMILAAFLLGIAAAGQIPLRGLDSVPAGAVIAALGILALMPVLAIHLPAAMGVFVIWLIIEDLVRKLAGNDIRVYFLKDFIFVAVLVALALQPGSRGTWKRATGSSRILLYAMIAWALVMSIPTGLFDWRLPVIGLRLNFMYLPLTAVGFFLAKDAHDLRKWLGILAILAGLASAVGIAQAIIGPDFLSPGRPTPGLHNLVLVRGLGESGAVYRPTGTFVDPGRFASMGVAGLAVALAALMGQKGKVQPWLLVAGITSAAAVWISGGRAGFVIALGMVLVALSAPTLTDRRIRLGVVGIGIVSLTLAIGALTALQPSLISSRSEWYRTTLDPGSSGNEWGFRVGAYRDNTVRGIAVGGVIGQGTGKESLGQQYIRGGEEASLVGLYQVEGGYASVAVEWGIVGLILWLLWTSAWTWRLWISIRSVRGSPLAMSGIILMTWTIFFLFIGFVAGLQGFQNYTSNALFWLFSGMVFALPHTVGATASSISMEPQNAA